MSSVDQVCLCEENLGRAYPFVWTVASSFVQCTVDYENSRSDIMQKIKTYKATHTWTVEL